MRGIGMTLVEIMIVVVIIGLLAAITIPGFIKAREESQKNTCIENLRQIEKAKEQWALANNKNIGEPVEEAEVNKLIKGGAPKCPAGGTYTYRPVGTHPTCNHKSSQHKLP